MEMTTERSHPMHVSTNTLTSPGPAMKLLQELLDETFGQSCPGTARGRWGVVRWSRNRGWSLADNASSLISFSIPKTTGRGCRTYRLRIQEYSAISVHSRTSFKDPVLRNSVVATTTFTVIYPHSVNSGSSILATWISNPPSPTTSTSFQHSNAPFCRYLFRAFPSHGAPLPLSSGILSTQGISTSQQRRLRWTTGLFPPSFMPCVENYPWTGSARNLCMSPTIGSPGWSRRIKKWRSWGFMASVSSSLWNGTEHLAITRCEGMLARSIYSTLCSVRRWLTDILPPEKPSRGSGCPKLRQLKPP